MRSLSENGSLDDQISRLEDMGSKIGGKSDDEVDNLNDFILSNFVPIPIPILNKKRVIADAFVRL